MAGTNITNYSHSFIYGSSANSRLRGKTARPIDQRGGNTGGKGCRILPADLPWGCIEVLFGGCTNAIDAGAEFDDIQVDLQNAILSPDRFHPYSPPRLYSLPGPSSGTKGEKILGRLPPFTMRSNMFDMFGKDFIGVSKYTDIWNKNMMLVKMEAGKL